MAQSLAFAGKLLLAKLVRDCLVVRCAFQSHDLHVLCTTRDEADAGRVVTGEQLGCGMARCERRVLLCWMKWCMSALLSSAVQC